MIAQGLIKDTIPSVKLTDSCQEVLQWMSAFHLSAFPVVDDKEYLGLVFEAELLDTAAKEDCSLNQLQLDFKKVFCRNSDHVFDIIKLIKAEQVPIVPILNEDQEYIGIVTQENVIDFFAGQMSLGENGAVIVIAVAEQDYSLSEIAQIIENNGAKVLNLYLFTHPESGKLNITLKLNIPEIDAIISSLQRYDYDVKALFYENSYNDMLKDRFDSLMHYLNI